MDPMVLENSGDLTRDSDKSQSHVPDFRTSWQNVREKVTSIEEAEITKNWHPTLPLVSVLITSYNFEDFITDAIGGALVQESSYPFEIIVRDDGSTDETPSIVLALANRFPQIVRPVLLERNSGLRTRADQEIKKHARGEFLALCDGDDFWLEEDKLQKQASVLMHNQNISLVHHMSFTLTETTGNLGRIRPSPEFRRDFSKDDLARAPKLSKSTVMYRNLPIPQINYSRDIAPSMDVMTFQLLSEWGGAHYIPNFIGSCKRLHGSNSSSGLPALQTALAPRLTRIFLGEILASSGRQVQAMDVAFEGATGVLSSLFRWKLVTPARIALWALRYGIYRSLRRFFRART